MCIFSAWSPALRPGRGWKEYLLFDFRVNVRLTMVRIGKPTAVGTSQGLRVLDTVTIEASNVPGNYYEYVSNGETYSNDTLIFDKPITARFAKIIIKPTSSGNEESYPLAVNK